MVGDRWFTLELEAGMEVGGEKSNYCKAENGQGCFLTRYPILYNYSLTMWFSRKGEMCLLMKEVPCTRKKTGLGTARPVMKQLCDWTHVQTIDMASKAKE